MSTDILSIDIRAIEECSYLCITEINTNLNNWSNICVGSKASYMRFKESEFLESMEHLCNVKVKEWRAISRTAAYYEIFDQVAASDLSQRIDIN